MEDKEKELQEQSEKPDTEKKETNAGMALGLSIGLALGVAVGTATKNLGLWMPIGMCMGMCVGIAFDSQKKKKDDGNDQPQA